MQALVCKMEDYGDVSYKKQGTNFHVMCMNKSSINESKQQNFLQK